MKAKYSVALLGAAVALTGLAVNYASADASLCRNNYVCIFDNDKLTSWAANGGC